MVTALLHLSSCRVGASLARGAPPGTVRAPLDAYGSTSETAEGYILQRGLGVIPTKLQAFRVKVTAAGNETFEAWRKRDHDDLVLAVACAAWLAEKGTRSLWVM